ncbi:hypothetical protein FisN_2HuN19 [Fistulifera solaris]|jgi:hypothetical protein|uniref:Uncharacterized protein n=1 Tax=Fistulifera solaris TaxID=1519565 RepID=A0A1Z5JGE7_FISSO|nr:hypothetical protein FisN_2HuN19 [Fistulifera solaris]|eukprot:GAX13080.1 hypothetical protein FisN_2HuN19 [Fistulifera solaris]
MDILHCAGYCSISDEGLALVDYLEHDNGTRTLSTFESLSCEAAWMKILEFIQRSTYPVFNELVHENYDEMNLEKWTFFARANVNSIKSYVSRRSVEEGQLDAIVESLRNGTMRAHKLDLRFSWPDESTFRDLFDALSSTECRLKDLRFHATNTDSRMAALINDKYIINMLHANISLETLGIKCEDDSPGFLSMGILNAAAEHPCLRKLIFRPPAELDPPPVRQSDPFNIWYRNNPSLCILIDTSRSYWNNGAENWQDYVHFCRFGLLQQVSNERIRSHLLVAALANHSSSPKRIHYLLSENQDVFAK